MQLNNQLQMEEMDLGVYMANPDYSTNSALNSVTELNAMIHFAMSSIQGLGPAQLSNALKILAEEFDAITLAVIETPCTLADSIIGMFNGFLNLAGIYGTVVIQELLGPCSTVVRGITSGPMSGAQVGFPKTRGFVASTAPDPFILTEDFGKTATRAALAITRFGEASGNSDLSPYGGALDTISITTASRAQQSANQEAIINLSRLMGLTTAARIAIRIDYMSHDLTIELMDEITDAIDIQLLKLGNDSANTGYTSFGVTIASPDSYQALKSLRSIFVRSMLTIGASLTKIIKFEVPPDIISSLELAYDKYEDLDREEEVITKNIPLIKHPGFLPGGQNLELLDV